MKKIIILFFLFSISHLYSQDEFKRKIYETKSENVTLQLFATEENRFYGHDYRGKVDIIISKSNVESERIIGRMSSSNKPYYIDDNYFIFTIKMDDRFRIQFFILDLETGVYHIYGSNAMYIANIVIYEDYLYYSTEKNDFTIGRIDFKSDEIQLYEDYYLPNTDFFIYNSNIYAYSDHSDKENVYLIGESLVRNPKDNYQISLIETPQMELLWN
ncbi:MAG: hypothetical protein PQJ44_02300 [Sphaerochaetaceae bacterium]|nr:hypothetical protein [Sphaerochaetaceae bacterium]